MELYKILNKSCCTVNLKSRNKDEVLHELAEHAMKSELLKNWDEENIYTALLAREAEGSTGFGDGTALPHIRLKGLTDFLVFIGASKHGIDFDAVDKKKVRLFFVIIAPEEKVNEHVQILAGVSRVLTGGNVKKELLAAKTQGVLYETFLKHLQKVSAAGMEKRKMKVMFIILYYDEFLYNILEYFIQEGIDGATILESSGMGEYISNIPLFATFIGFMNERKNSSKTIMALIPEEREQELIEGIEEITGDLNKKDGAMILTLEASFYKGSMKMM
ncbi:MAG: PTS sugar transporter subunit IIA [Spirochaetia bacterium]|nr:PTS sugar transporter subunit IIA [Spirochaetia bacterium]